MRAQTLADYDIKKVLGTGSFGKVLLVKDKADKSVPGGALKIISKDRIIRTKQVEHTIGEKDILFCANSKFIVRLFDYFLDAKNVYLMLEFASGGEMFTVIQRQPNRRFTAVQTRFFAAETIMAFEYLHNIDVLHRDLKCVTVAARCCRALAVVAARTYTHAHAHTRTRARAHPHPHPSARARARPP